VNLRFSCASIALLESGSLEAILNATQPRVVIVGGGFGGLFATRALAGAPVSVTLIDKRNYHLFRPMLYQVATGLLSADQIAGPLRSILNQQKNVEVLLDEVSGIDTQKRLVHLKQHVIPYDFLVLATGIQYNYLGAALLDLLISVE
jgi:NADH:ubiquinone reductase (H+-translocating)